MHFLKIVYIICDKMNKFYFSKKIFFLILLLLLPPNWF